MKLPSHLLRNAAALVAALLSSGWIVLLWLSAESLLCWFRSESREEMHSLPHLAFSRQTLFWGCVWLMGVVCVWAFLFTKQQLDRKRI